MLILTLLLSLLASFSTAGATMNHYTGFANTAKSAYLATAVMKMDSHPDGYSDCYVRGWTSLEEESLGQYVRAGIGYAPGSCPKGNPVSLWWVSAERQKAEIVACVPLHTEVKVDITKEEGIPAAFVVWEWGNERIGRTVPLTNWVYGPGTYPTKVEVFSASEKAPKPVSITMKDVLLHPEDRSLLWQSSYPYQLRPDPSFRNFTVEYSTAHPWAYIEE